MKGGFILYNGKFYREDQELFSGTDLHRLGIGLCESFRVESNEILFVESVYRHILDAANAIDLTLPADYDLEGLHFRRNVSRLLNKNKLFLSARVVIQIFPGKLGADILLSAEELPRDFFPLNENGLLVDFYTKSDKTNNLISNFEPGSRYLWMKASKIASDTGKQNMILLNHEGNACEAIGCSFAFIKEKLLYFPATGSGGYQPMFINQVARSAELCGLKASPKDEISTDDLLEAEEIFLIDNCLGIQKVLGISDSRYYSAKTAAIAQIFSEMAKADRASRN